MSDPLPPGGNPPVAPPVDPPAPAPMNRAAADAARAETERVERASIEAAIERFNVNYNQNGGPPLPRLVSPTGRLGTAPNVPPRGPVQGPAQGGAQALQPDYSSSSPETMVDMQMGELDV